ncbi:MAG: nucleotidyl transferase AbiEii/AbiGii toxin family protein [Deltaproteobacteria bacterium]|jgi:hypothetical protein|nr:nucleotidyl transferase AbiEii/AbiGii toxin family protein [Deltaproteobacteria bacterium]
MTNFSGEVIIETSRKPGFNPCSFEKINRPVNIPRFVAGTDDYGRPLTLHGGTAINPTIFPLSRLSSDMDFAFAENLSTDETVEWREKIHKFPREHATDEGYTTNKKSIRSRVMDKLACSLVRFNDRADSLKIEVSRIVRNRALPPTETATRTEGVNPDLNIRARAPIDMFAGEIVALTNRGAPRDPYDANDMLDFNLFGEQDPNPPRKRAVLCLAITGARRRADSTWKKIDDITEIHVKKDLENRTSKLNNYDLAAVKTRV